MIAIAALLLVQQGTSVQIGVDSKTGASLAVQMHPSDSTARRDSLRRAATFALLTPDVVRTAYLDAGARTLVDRARQARFAQDSSIESYRARTLQRMTADLGITKYGPERMLVRYEASSIVTWKRGVGASIQVTGRRAAAPMIGKDVTIDIDDFMSPVPYYPGRDALWAGVVTVKDDIDKDDMIHPLATAAEVYYTYQTGDSISFTLPNGTVFRLHEVLVRPRQVSWRTVVGSLWFDISSGQLVRAAFKLSEPLDLWTVDPNDPDQPPAAVKAIFSPMKASIDGMAIEYGLHDGKYWMPRSQAFEGGMQLTFIHVPMKIEETFEYDGVNGNEVVTIPPVVIDSSSYAGKTGPARDSAVHAVRVKRDSLETVRREMDCRETGSHDSRVSRYDGALVTVLRVPCDTKVLATSPTLPPLIYDDNDEIFGDAMRDDLMKRAKSLMPEPSLGLHKPAIRWTVDQLRFNRVEGLSSSVTVDQSLGRDLSLTLVPRIGVADRVFNGELSLTQRKTNSSVAVTGYRRLVSASDYGDPLSFGSSLSAALFGRDEGMYYRAAGAELSGEWLASTRVFWNGYAQREGDAIARNTHSLPELLGSDGFQPEANINAQPATQYGGSLRFVNSRGVDPQGWRALTDFRVDGATGDFKYGRSALDLTISHPIAGPYGASLTMSGGSSLGTVPVQRLFYLGGSSTVRGQTIGAMSGNAYWFGRAEFGKGVAGRRVIFADLGWAGDRDHLDKIGRPMSGVGVGFSLLDGLFRFDVARGLYPQKQFRVTLYMDSKY